ncbi:MAG: hypothetical protein JW940_02150 [Polyangiaceae bacterium]|nr:hypothetical protein [Polyangiaceae bacterium]
MVALPTLASVARAQSTEESTAAARSLASQGASAFEAGRYSESLDFFTRAESLVHAPPHILYMARCAEKLGNLVQAREYYIRIIREELPKTAPQAFRDAQTAAHAEVGRIEPRIASLVIVVKAPEGAKPSVTLDGSPVTDALIGVPFPVDPGKHALVATAPGMKTGQADVELADAERRQVELVLEPAAATGPAAAAPPQNNGPVAANQQAAPAAVPEDTGDMGPNWMRMGAYAGLGVGVVGIAAGTYFGLRSASKRSDADKAAEACGSRCVAGSSQANEIDSLDDSARSAQTVSIVSFIVGGLGLASGVTLYVLSGQDSSSGTSGAHWTPWVGLGSAGVSGSF